MRVVGIVQARMASTRLPGKVLLEAAGRPLLVHMLQRVSWCESVDDLWLATSDQPADDPLAEAVRAHGFRVFRGSENDVLGRFYELAKGAGADVVVRLTGDCPLHDPSVIDGVVDAFLGLLPSYRYASNIWPPTYPDGLDVEVFTFEALEEVALTSDVPLEREHVGPGIHRQLYEDRPKVLNLSAPADFSHLRWTLDYPEDYAMIRAVFEELHPRRPDFTWWDVLALTTRQPGLLELNRREERNETFMAEARAWLAAVPK